MHVSFPGLYNIFPRLAGGSRTSLHHLQQQQQ